jgi:hypothetical protein
MGMSFGIPGCRVGVSSTGRKYISFGFPGTGLYFIKYLTNSQPIIHKQQTKINKQYQKTENKQNTEPWWKQKNL